MQFAEIVEHVLALSADDRICLLEKLEESLASQDGFANPALAQAVANEAQRHSSPTNGELTGDAWEIVRARLNASPRMTSYKPKFKTLQNK